MYFTFKKNNKQTKKPVNRLFLQDCASAGIRSLQTSIAKVHGTELRIADGPIAHFCHS